jgi:hypothetical protein
MYPARPRPTALRWIADSTRSGLRRRDERTLVANRVYPSTRICYSPNGREASMVASDEYTGGDKAAIRDGRIVIAERFYPSRQIGSCCGCLTGPKRREGLSVERWVCSECSAEHERDARNQPSKARAG